MLTDKIESLWEIWRMGRRAKAAFVRHPDLMMRCEAEIRRVAGAHSNSRHVRNMAVGLVYTFVPEEPLGIARVQTCFRLLNAFVPSRTANEEIGDALEWIERLLADRTQRRVELRIICKTAATVFWVLANSIRYAVSSFLRKRAE
jgi:hypothetical protein